MKLNETRKIDSLGRVILPAPQRKETGINLNSEVNVFLNDNQNIEISLKTPSCFICYSPDDILEFKNKYICKNCKDLISKIE